MYKIANETQTDILTINPALPQALVDVINKTLDKMLPSVINELPMWQRICDPVSQR